MRFVNWWKWMFDERNIIIPTWFMGWFLCETLHNIGDNTSQFWTSLFLFVINWYFYRRAKKLLSEDNTALQGKVEVV
jgi:hypothetical protein